MEPIAPHEITRQLCAWEQGENAALDRLMPLVYAELHRIAHLYMRRECVRQTLQTSALVNETYLKLRQEHGMHWQNRAHFFAVASQMMRQILVDYARCRCAAKRGGQQANLPLDEATLVLSEDKLEEFLALDEALMRLAAFDLRKSRIAELRFFGGMTVEEIAQTLEIAPITVMREWRTAKAWLFGQLCPVAELSQNTIMK